MAGDADELVACLPADIDSIGLPYPGVPVTTRSWSDFIAGHASMHDYTPPNDDAVAMLIYTSGTSGPPKGVMTCNASIPFAIYNTFQQTICADAHSVQISYRPPVHMGTSMLSGG